MSTDLMGRLEQFQLRATLADLEEAANVIKVTSPTILGWLNGGALPKGETMLRLQHYLSMKHLHPDELNAIPEPALQLGRYIAYDVLTIDEAKRAMGYASTNDLYRLLNGASLMTSRAQMLAKLLNDWRAQFESSQPDIKPFSAAITSAPQVASTSTADASSNASFTVQHVAGSILTTAALVESLILSDEHGVDGVLALVGEDRIFDLIDNLRPSSS